MPHNALAGQAAFNRRQMMAGSGPRQMVENRTIFASHGAELSIYDTFASAEKVRLEAEEVLYCGMISGKKILHGKQHFNSEFLPHESFVMAPGERVDIDFPEATLNDPTSCLTLGISRERLRQVCDQLNQKNPLPQELGEWSPQHDHVLHVFHTEATQQLLVRIVDSFMSNDTDRDLVLNLGVTELLTRMLRQQGRNFLLHCARNDPTLNGLTEVVRYIDEHLAEAIDVERLCKIACMSRSKFYQQFRHVMGTGPMEYLQQRRLERARELIAGGRGITEVCYEVGYVSPSHFTRRFHQQYGVSPRDYMLQHQRS
ncbi:MAG: AraC family transcriptional regulator [Pseudomonadota bacterium]|nr:AraC family transcriptional regulator [Pseudomonadota bacterium]